ncbi:hypothetical protein F4677DRAFT_464382 [Hypoxylon crocopeplum]|nr:hypothetical protein F4677DRAFT_464382 [Hypoxylon crocopeplum]
MAVSDELVLAVSYIMFTSCIISIVLRLYSRKLTKTGLGWDDGLILVATALAIALFGLSIYTWDVGYERLMFIAPGRDRHMILSLLLSINILYKLCMCFTKFSAICLYTRIFIERKFRFICKIVGVIIGLFYIYVFIQSFTLSEIAVRLWNNANLEKDMNNKRADSGMAIFNIVGNVVVLALPIRPLWKLQMRTKTKISLTVLFFLGICVAVVSAIRLSYILQSGYDTTMLINYGSRDMHLQVLETELAIFSLCLPVLRPVWHKLRENYSSATEKSTNSHRMSSITTDSRICHDDDHARWSGIIADENQPRYDVEVRAEAPSPTEDKSDLCDTFKQILRPEPRREEVKPPQLAHISVDKCWHISYEAAAASR